MTGSRQGLPLPRPEYGFPRFVELTDSLPMTATGKRTERHLAAR